MRNILPLKKISQFDPDIHKRYRASACGPVTAYAILDYYFPNRFQDINQLYKRLGGTAIGLFTWRFVRNLSKLLGDDWVVATCSIEEVKKQIDKGYPVAAKFDKWFRWKWRGRYSFDYHWVPIVGYEESESGLMLFIHDNGGKNRPCQIRKVPYAPNRDILTFVKIDRKKRQQDDW
ncbi:C39 family peptidase [Sporosarcina pasteurii]|uniref:Peptidase C39-like domain-containing protein n=1 Tax=Sporosarcina pasteurii TaxID=1474 RepID=A0A380CB18_SPOPA|nr:C39 family peptidase [Sporosarcina pasteurii]MDS9472743.1 C39 family peptidase [Sporosarcina pasteurii]QBQ04395.1 hypothetical protein E2C16_01155 [Sporosarcina pasteurii]SUJ15405.1 Uncharacterised protein [Sporosarcina pasteurii]